MGLKQRVDAEAQCTHAVFVGSHDFGCAGNACFVTSPCA
jgi:hypothetical protein